MKKILIILLSCVPSLYSWGNNRNLHEKFNTLKGIDYSQFSDMIIENRKGVYIVTYQEATYIIKWRFFRKKISSVEKVFGKDTIVFLTKQDIDYIENALKSFNEIGILALSVDKKGNVSLSLPWYDRCTYYFLRLSSMNTLDQLKLKYYQNYENNWYLYKECAEKW